MTKALTIRRAQADDAGQVLVLQRAAYVLDAQLYGDPMIEPLTETFEDIRSAVVDVNAVLLVATAGDRVIGFVRGKIQERSCQLDRLAVAPDRQGVGVGSALVEAIEAEVDGRVDRLLADEADRGQARVRLFVRHGFTEAYRDAAGHDRVRIFLRKDLPSAPREDTGLDQDPPEPEPTPPVVDPTSR